MTRRSRREIEKALDGLTDDEDTDDLGDPCPACGGGPPGTDAKLGITAEFATAECTCDVDRPEGVTPWTLTPGRGRERPR
jgi:hypothetical protein